MLSRGTRKGWLDLLDPRARRARRDRLEPRVPPGQLERRVLLEPREQPDQPVRPGQLEHRVLLVPLGLREPLALPEHKELRGRPVLLDRQDRKDRRALLAREQFRRT